MIVYMLVVKYDSNKQIVDHLSFIADSHALQPPVWTDQKQPSLLPPIYDISITEVNKAMFYRNEL